MTLRAPQDTSGKDVSANAGIMLTVQAHYDVKCRPFKTNRRCDLDSCCLYHIDTDSNSFMLLKMLIKDR